MTELNIDSQSVNFDRRTALIGTGAVAASALLLSKDVKALPLDPAIDTYVDWRKGEIETLEAITEFEAMEASLPDGFLTVTYSEVSPRKIVSEERYHTHEELDKVFGPSKGDNSFSAKRHSDLDEKINQRKRAKAAIQDNLDCAKARVDQANKNDKLCKQAIFSATPTTILGAALKMNAISSYNGIEDFDALVVLQDEMFEMARLQGQFVENLPVELFNLRELDVVNWVPASNGGEHANS